MNLAAFIALILSIIIQFAAVVLAIRFIRLTDYRVFWLLISAGLVLMIVRRIAPLYYLVSDPEYKIALSNEILGIIISTLMFFGLRGIGVLFMEHLKIEKDIKKLLEEKQLLLKEVHHRIKNNMSTISSLLSLQAAPLEDPVAVEALDDARTRVESMTLLYDKLYRSENFYDADISEYIELLADEIIAGFPGSEAVTVKKELESINLDARRIQTLAILINEILTNTMKYAFGKTKEPEIVIKSCISGDKAVLSIHDNGKGIQKELNKNNSSGFGMTLIYGLVQQLEGTYSIVRNGGTEVTIEFKL